MNLPNIIQFQTKIWLYSGEAAWHFITVPPQESKRIRETFSGIKRGWGSLPVQVTIGKTSWKTSIFPDKKAGAYLLPLKAAVRKKEKLAEGDLVEIQLEIIVN